MTEMCSNCDVLIHEATNEDSHQEKCIANGHSTPSMAANFATQTKSKFLVLNHVSQRFDKLIKSIKIHVFNTALYLHFSWIAFLVARILA